MPNWATTNYVIEGNPESLKKISDAILHPTCEPGSDKSWEGNVLKTLSPTLDLSKRYTRGFISDVPSFDKVLAFSAEEAWGVTDFDDVLTVLFDDINVYWMTEEPGMEVYQTNDAKGKYFTDRFFVDTAQNDSYESEYFETEKEVYEWLTDITQGKVKTKADVEKFNEEHENAGTGGENFIYVHKFEVVNRN